MVAALLGALVANAPSTAEPTSIPTKPTSVTTETASITSKTSAEAATATTKAASEPSTLEARASGWPEARFCHALFCVSTATQSTTEPAWFPACHKATPFDVDTYPTIFDADTISFLIGGYEEEEELQGQSTILKHVRRCDEWVGENIEYLSCLSPFHRQ